MHRIFSGDGWLVFPDILKSARDHRPSQRLLQQPPVLIILHIDVPFIVLLDGSAQSRGAGARLAGKREFPKGDRPAFREVARRIPPPHHRDDTPGSAGVPPACCPLGCRSVSLRCCSRPPCQREPHGPGRSRALAPLPVDSGGGDGRSCGRICAGGTPALPGGFHPMRSSHQGHTISEAFWYRLPLILSTVRGSGSCVGQSSGSSQACFPKGAADLFPGESGALQIAPALHRKDHPASRGSERQRPCPRVLPQSQPF